MSAKPGWPAKGETWKRQESIRRSVRAAAEFVRMCPVSQHEKRNLTLADWPDNKGRPAAT